jgi:hypothetical protein
MIVHFLIPIPSKEVMQVEMWDHPKVLWIVNSDVDTPSNMTPQPTKLRVTRADVDAQEIGVNPRTNDVTTKRRRLGNVPEFSIQEAGGPPAVYSYELLNLVSFHARSLHRA